MAWYRIAENILTAMANAINAKTGKTAPMTPVDMVSEIQSIQTDGGDPWDKFISFMRNKLTSIPALNGVTSVGEGMFQSCTNLTSFDFSNIQSIGANAFYGARLAGVVVLPREITTLGRVAFRGNQFTKIVFKGGVNRFDASLFEDCTMLEVIDTKMTNSALGINVSSLYKTQSLTTMILRQNFVAQLSGAFPSTCGLATSGNIYVPSSLVDTYKAATNWSVYANKILSIEGSIYETQYADGAPVQTT